MPDLVLCIPTLNRFDALEVCIKSAQEGTVKPIAVVVMDNSAGKLQLYLEDNNIRLENTLIIRSPYNLGCSAAWNYMLKDVSSQLPDAYCVVSNDDITFHEDTLEKFSNAIDANPNELFYCAGGIASPNAFSLFVTRYDKLETTVGLFDQFFRYPYCEDGDMAIRVWQYGKDLFKVEGCNADHIGSATLAAFEPEELERHHIRFQRNAEYFYLKWGIDHNSIHKSWKDAKAFEHLPEELVQNYIVGKYGH